MAIIPDDEDVPHFFQSNCSVCGDQVEFVGTYWRHMTGPFRHLSPPIRFPNGKPRPYELGFELVAIVNERDYDGSDTEETEPQGPDPDFQI